MAEARQREAWEHTSSICWVIAETSRDPKQRPTPWTRNDFTPFPTVRKAEKVMMVDFSMLRSLLMPTHG